MKCDICENLEDGDTLYVPSDWDGGIGFDYIRDIKYCPVCGRKLRAEQTEPQIEGVWNAGFKTGYDKGYKDAQKVKDSQDLVKDLVKAFCEDGTWLERQGVYTLTLAEAKQRAVDIIESVTQTETQNSNLTFEKADERCKGCKHYKLTCDLFSEICKYEPKTEPQMGDAKPIPLSNRVTHIKDEPQTDCPWK